MGKSNKSCICGSINLNSYSYSKNYIRLKCVDCKSDTFDSTDAEIIFDYNKDNDKYNSELYLEGKQFRWAHDQINKILENENGEILEVGCFNGFYVNQLNKNGLNAFGIDLNKKAIQRGKSMYAEISEKLSNDNLNMLNRTFDVILLIDVLEHVSEIEEFMITIYSLLNDNGKLIISGPTNERFFFDRSDRPPHHTRRFSQKGLIYLSNRFSFKYVQSIIEYSFLLFLRNLIGWILSGCKKEYYGEGVIINVKEVKQGVFLKYVDKIGSYFLKKMNLQYCSRILVFKKE